MNAHERLKQEIENWKATAAQAQRNTEYYRGIVDRIALMLGEDAFTCDDGSTSTSPLRAKVAELVAERLLRLRDLEGCVGHPSVSSGYDLEEWLKEKAVSALENAHGSFEGLRNALDIQGQHGNWNCDPYMHGMYNGMEFALATLEAREPQYREAPEKWLLDKSAEQIALLELQVKGYQSAWRKILKALAPYPAGDGMSLCDHIISLLPKVGTPLPEVGSKWAWCGDHNVVDTVQAVREGNVWTEGGGCYPVEMFLEGTTPVTEKLYRMLEKGEFVREGDEILRGDIWVPANLRVEVKHGTFRRPL